MYHHCHSQRVASCLKKNHKAQRISDFYLTRHTHSLNKEYQIVGNKLLKNKNYKRVKRCRNMTKMQKKGLHSLTIGPNPAFGLHALKHTFRFHLTSKYNYFKNIAKQIAQKSSTNGSKPSPTPVTAITLQSYIYQNVTIFATVRGLLHQINGRFSKNPFLAAALCVLLTGLLADAFAQLKLEKKSMAEYDFERLAQFGLYSFITFSCLGYVLANHVYFKLFPGVCLKQTCKKVAFEELLYVPFFQFPFFYVFKEFFSVRKENKENNNNNNNNGIKNEFPNDLEIAWKNAMDKYGKNFLKDNIAAICVWGPAQMITYGVLPMHLRVPFITMVSFVWLCGLSYFRMDNNENGDKCVEDGMSSGDEFEYKEEPQLISRRRKTYNEKRLEAIEISSMASMSF